MKKIISLVLSLTLVLSLSIMGCANNSDANPNTGTPSTPDELKDKVDATVDEAKDKVGPLVGEAKDQVNSAIDGVKKEMVDIDITAQIKKEAKVKDARIYESGGVIFGSITMEDDVKEADAKSLAQSYLETLQEEFPGKTINMTVVGNKKSLANLTSSK